VITAALSWTESDRAGSLARAVAILRGGGLVAFPTETVYGLGAAASHETAVRGIFAAKGRPSGVPLIVHVTDVDLASRYVRRMPEAAIRLASHFWPGPLTLVLDRGPHVSRAVTGGGETVAVRAPAHDAALALIEALGEGIAAPSANRHNDLPPVRAAHVLRGLAGAVDAVLDAGRCPGGLESTVLDLTRSPARVLRRGAVSIDRLAALVDVEDGSAGPATARMVGGWISVVDLAEAMAMAGAGTGVVLRTWPREAFEAIRARVEVLPTDAAGYASQLYDVLHDLRDAGCDRVVVEPLPDGSEWEAMRDRIARLASAAASG